LTPSSGSLFFEGKTFFYYRTLTGLVGHQRWGMEECYTHFLQTFDWRHDRLRQLTLSVSFVEECIGGGRFTSNVTWTPIFRKEQLTRKGLSQLVQKHNQHRVARIEPVFCQYRPQYATRCNLQEVLTFNNGHFETLHNYKQTKAGDLHVSCVSQFLETVRVHTPLGFLYFYSQSIHTTLSSSGWHRLSTRPQL
jgi:hypothetical protein